MLHNRLSAVAVSIYLDPSNHVQRMKIARSYVDFAHADETARCGVIRGMDLSRDHVEEGDVAD